MTNIWNPVPNKSKILGLVLTPFLSRRIGDLLELVESRQQSMAYSSILNAMSETPLCVREGILTSQGTKPGLSKRIHQLS